MIVIHDLKKSDWRNWKGFCKIIWENVPANAVMPSNEKTNVDLLDKVFRF